MSKKEPKPEIKDCTETLRVTLTTNEILAFAREGADAVQELTAIEKSFEEVKAEFKAKIAAKETIIVRNSVLVKNGYEMRPVDCQWRYFAKTKQLWRMDTGELVRESRLEPWELQKEIPDMEPATA